MKTCEQQSLVSFRQEVTQAVKSIISEVFHFSRKRGNYPQSAVLQTCEIYTYANMWRKAWEEAQPPPQHTNIKVVILGVGTWIRSYDQRRLWSFLPFCFSLGKWTQAWVVKLKITFKNIFYDLQMDISCPNLPFTQHHAWFHRKHKKM